MVDPNEVVVIAFPDEGKAQEVLGVLHQMDKQHLVHLKNAAIIVRHKHGQVEVHETHDFNAKQGMVTGALAGGLLGALTGGGLLKDAALGAAAGFGASKVLDLGFKDDYLREVAQSLQPGSSALVAVIHFDQVDEAMRILDQFAGGTVLRTTLAPEVAQQLATVVAD